MEKGRFFYYRIVRKIRILLLIIEGALIFRQAEKKLRQK